MSHLYVRSSLAFLRSPPKMLWQSLTWSSHREMQFLRAARRGEEKRVR